MAQGIEHRPLDAAFAALLTNGLDGAGEALRILANEASRIERNHFLNAQPHERTAECTDYANGSKPKTMMTRVGELTFDVPASAARARGLDFVDAGQSCCRTTGCWPGRVALGKR